jgi:predicted O-linked N-acetylglucosamine transferase (SPINDLY family)
MSGFSGEAMATIAEALALAVQSYQAGQLAQTEHICRQILQVDGAQAVALHLLGLTAHQAGRPDVALPYMQQAVALNPQTVEFHANLGVVYHALGRWTEAVACHEQALRLRPDVPGYHYNLGRTLSAHGRHGDALNSLREALRLQPDFADAHNEVGNVLKKMGRLAEAEARYRAALLHRPAFPEAHNNLGTVLAELGRLEEAQASYQDALRLSPSYPEAYNNLGDALRQLGRLEDAEASCRQALRLRPDVAEFHCNLGQALAEQGRDDEALASCRQAIRLRPEVPALQHNLALALLALGKPDEALASYEQAVQIFPQSALLLNSLANLYRDRGRIAEAIACYRKAAAAAPTLQYIQSNLLLALHYPADYDPEATFAEHVSWARQFEGLPARHPSREAIDRDPGRRLRIGYVSGDFREHVMGRYSEAIVTAHDRHQVDVFCYANVRKEDARTQRLRAAADHWRSVVGLSDTEAADLIVQDRIDVLIDLAGHTGGNRLGIFAHKPAPIQVTHCGYPDTTGLTAIDYRLMDPSTDPPGRTERFHTEKVIRLPGAHWCYAPPYSPEVSSVQAREAGEVTFGSFNILAKVTDPMIGLWAQILKELPRARLTMLVGAGTELDERVRRAFLRHQIDLDRITPLSWKKGEAYYRLFHDLDICLDTYPYTGCNTTADALWMGVPVVTLAGPTCVTRLGVSAMVLAGLNDLVTETPTAYVETAVRLARDLPRLHELRTQLRDRVKLTLGDVPGFTRQLEVAYREMWQVYCEKKSLE